MLVQVVSDLHYNWEYKAQGADILVIAGDLGNGIGELVRLMKKITDIPVYFVLGNHDYYGEVQQDVVPLVRKLTEGTNWTLLENDIVTHEDVRLVGTTLWTNCGGPYEQWFTKQAIKNWPDFQYIKFAEKDGTIRRKQVEDMYPDYVKAVDFLEFAIKEPFDGKTLVITHFVPTRKATHPRFARDPGNHYFATDLERLMYKGFTWVFGHTHDPYDFYIGDTRLVCNPVGYHREGTGYKGDLIIEI